MRAKSFLVVSVCAALFAAAGAQTAFAKTPRPNGTMVTLPVTASIEVANDQNGITATKIANRDLQEIANLSFRGF